MKQIKKVVLKDAKLLSTNEMKLLFGGSGSKMTSCTTDCGSQGARSITNCIGSCTSNPGSSVVCSGATKILTKYCDGTSSLVIRV